MRKNAAPQTTFTQIMVRHEFDFNAFILRKNRLRRKRSGPSSNLWTSACEDYAMADDLSAVAFFMVPKLTFTQSRLNSSNVTIPSPSTSIFCEPKQYRRGNLKDLGTEHISKETQRLSLMKLLYELPFARRSKPSTLSETRPVSPLKLVADLRCVYVTPLWNQSN